MLLNLYDEIGKNSLRFKQKIKKGDLETNLVELKKNNDYLDIEIQKRWTRQLIAAIKFLSDSKIIHRDVKPSNILVAENIQQDGTKQFDLKLGDFGLAREFGM